VRGDSAAVTVPAWLEPSQPDLTRYAELLSTTGVTAGLIGPREVPRIWDRHLLNCAVVAEPGLGLVPAGATVADVGSGAGLPGLVWAIARPDIRVTLVEPLLRRATFLTETVTDLNLADRVTVLRTRAEDLGTAWPGAMVVTARAVAPLAKLLTWTAPLMAPQGRLIAFKGASAEREITEASELAAQLGLGAMRAVTVGEPPATVVLAER
jgi:16S rRNA (guanine527-N7)-methyltransferase